MYYDRGELFSYFSPGYAIGTVTGGPFGANQQLPFVNVSTCPSTQSLYEYYIPTCGGNGGFGPPTGRPPPKRRSRESIRHQPDLQRPAAPKPPTLPITFPMPAAL